MKAIVRSYGVLFGLLLSVAFAPAAYARDTPLSVTVKGPFVELQLFPGRGYPKFHAVEKHQQLRLLKSRAGWYKVATEDGVEGWVHRRDLVDIYDDTGKLVDFSVPNWSDAADPWHMGLLGSQLGGVGAYNLLLGYRFTANFSTELRYSQAFGDFSNTKVANLSLVHQAFPHWRYSPFFSLGAGVLKTFPDAVLVEAEDRQDSVLTLGTGLFIYLNHKVVVRFEYNKHTVLTTQANNDEVEEWKAGLSVFF